MYKLNFNYKGKDIYFEDLVAKKLAGKVVDWLFSNGYKFDNDLHKAFTKRPISLEDLKKSNVSDIYLKRLRHFHKMPDGNLLFIGGNVEPIEGYIKQMLVKFGINESSIKTEGFQSKSDKIKKFADLTDDEEDPVISEYSENPFKQAICVLGESGAGKSHTIETILENEGHEFEFIIPTAATTGLLAQFSPTKSGYVPSRLGKMIIEAAQNPDTLYTAVFDECHKSSTIEMINDELLQCISIHRNNGVRFISLDHDTAELYNVEGLEKKRGNIILPDNFGFIFISSKPRVISNNADFFNRVDIVILRHFEEETIESSDELIEKVLDSDEKKKLVSTRND